jgi:hypothetical protein
VIDCTKYPFDIEKVAKGDVVGVAILEPYLGVPFEHKDYQLRLNELAAEVEAQLDRLGRGVVVSCVKGELAFHDDPAASKLTQHLFRSGLRRMVRNHRRLLKVDPTGLDQCERARHDRACVVQGAILAGVAEARRAALVPYRRNTPGLPAPVA